MVRKRKTKNQNAFHELRIDVQAYLVRNFRGRTIYVLRDAVVPDMELPGDVPELKDGKSALAWRNEQVFVTFTKYTADYAAAREDPPAREPSIRDMVEGAKPMDPRLVFTAPGPLLSPEERTAKKFGLSPEQVRRIVRAFDASEGKPLTD